MTSDQPPHVPRDCIAITAVEPLHGVTRQVLVRLSTVKAKTQGRIGAASELGHTVPYALQNPNAIFRGVREEGESQRLCYCASPPEAYNHQTGAKRSGWPGQIFLVFVNADGFVYNWRWEKSHVDDNRMPSNYENRFDERAL